MTSDALAAPRSAAKAAFGLALMVSTLVPFLAGGAQWLTGKTPVFPLQVVIGFLAGIHVPMTLYLLFDRGVRQMMRDRPIALILMPILIFAAVFAVTFLTAADRVAGTSSLMVLLSVFVLSWNIWHFGKQNVGVYSFFRISQAQTGMLPIEKKLIVIGSALGVMTTFALAGDQYIKTYASKIDMDWLVVIYHHVTNIGTIGQVALFAFASWFIVKNWHRHSWRSAVMFFLGANYFFPQYLIANSAAFSFVFACNTLGHGLQYLTFLGTHSTSGWRMPLIFCVTLVVLADFFVFHKVIGMPALNSFMVTHGASEAFIFALGETIVTGILLNHFWLDSYLWRFKDPRSRSWMTSRFAFLFER